MKLMLTLAILLLAVPGVRGGCVYAKTKNRTPWAAVGIFLATLVSVVFALVLLYWD